MMMKGVDFCFDLVLMGFWVGGCLVGMDIT
jgi:hypothetical protein